MSSAGASPQGGRVTARRSSASSMVACGRRSQMRSDDLPGRSMAWWVRLSHAAVNPAARISSIRFEQSVDLPERDGPRMPTTTGPTRCRALTDGVAMGEDCAAWPRTDVTLVKR